MRKVLFIDRDGTIIKEPEDEQIDSLEKLSFLPSVIHFLRKIVDEDDFDLVMVTNQDGLGTDSFPEDTFWPAHNKMMEMLEGEGIYFKDILIDKSFPHENKDTRKPGIGMMDAYLNGDFDLKNSYVIGDRLSDIELAKNLNSKGIFITNKKQGKAALEASNWKEIYEIVKLSARCISLERKTKETQISLQLNIDGKGKTSIETGIHFFDHMLDQVGKHSESDLTLKVQGDLHVDEHHTIEDTAIALGEAFRETIGDKKGIERYGYLIPMDDSLAQVAIDFSGRPWCVWDAAFKREKIGEMPTEMFFHFFKSFSDAALCNLNIKCEGDNEHHKIEAIFKAFAKSIKMAKKRDINNLMNLPSTKGML